MYGSLGQETLYILSREWPYLSCTELVVKPFYLLLCSIITGDCIIMFVKEMVIKYVLTGKYAILRLITTSMICMF